MRRRGLFKFLVSCSLLVWGWAPLLAADLDSELHDLEDFSRALSVIETQSLYPREHKELIDAAISGMLKDLDPYSNLLDAQGFERVKEVSKGRNFGVGLSLAPVGADLVITRVVPGTPAALAGLKRGQKVKAVNGQPIDSFDAKALSDLRFDGAPLKLTLSSGQQLTLQKTWYDNPGMRFQRPQPGILVAEVPEFFVDTPTQLAAELLREPPQTLILDLRDNPGGLVFSAVETAELLVGPGPIVETRDRQGKRLESFLARQPPVVPLKKLVLLLNGNSASAAEILAQSLKERGVAVLVGELSFGKGVVQTLFPLGRERFALLTVARYYGPSGKSFHGQGITPDWAVKDNLQAERWGPEDPIYQRALKLAVP
ncbi:MAG: S41 family peptidase [bacterium]|nr:S41 family peptidase [bacterium]